MADNLADLIKQSNAADLQVLLAAKEDAKRRVTDNPSAANLSALKKAKDILEQYLDGQNERETAYKNRASALRELQRRGYKLAKSKFYKDCDNGLCKRAPGGSIPESALERYIKHPRAGLKRLDRISEEKVAKEKTQAEIDKLKTQVSLLQHDLAIKEGKYVSREDAEMELAAVIGQVQNSLHHMLEIRTSDWVELVGGDSAKTKDLLAASRRDLDKRFNDLAKIDNFRVLFKIESAET
jgi:hypothetical protein